MKRHLFSIASVLMLTLLLTVPAYAASSGFTDVPQDVPYYESVLYLAEQGISVGVGGGRYAPDSPITVRQWAVMLRRAFEDADMGENGSGSFGEASLAYAYRRGWLHETALAEPDTRMCRGALYESAFEAIGLPVYDSTLYPDGKALSSYENCMRAGAMLGFCTVDTDPLEIVNRGEAAMLLHAILTEEFTVEEPVLLSKFPIQNDEGIHLNDCLLELRKVPEPILQEFQSRGWVYTINFDYLRDLGRRYGMTCIGAADYGQKRIYIAEASATLHEFGHFLDSFLGFPIKHEKLYAEEGHAAARLIRDYAGTNRHEFFADCFAYWVRNQDKPQMLERFKAELPETAAYLEELEVRGWQR